ncbi:hypothetical protein D4764_15G0005560 [Takifugu flavidus]|uniref:Endonuclease/exonuclease/phosphatase domain-containing protein n=1 Tax=Takifugu flavidus TaxID=433684 RepID=A0A5C6P044_9TELE|nr:hypothetical protein D4764_15G0005560 [Takifugu flavidus]
MLRNALVPDEGSLYLGVRETVVYRSWRPMVLEKYRSCMPTGPGGLRVLEVDRSWRSMDPGGLWVLEEYRSWMPMGLGGVPVLDAYRSWMSNSPGSRQSHWMLVQSLFSVVFPDGQVKVHIPPADKLINTTMLSRFTIKRAVESNLRLYGSVLESVENFHFLGVDFGQRLNWTEQINQVEAGGGMPLWLRRKQLAANYWRISALSMVRHRGAHLLLGHVALWCDEGFQELAQSYTAESGTAAEDTCRSTRSLDSLEENFGRDLRVAAADLVHFLAQKVRRRRRGRRAGALARLRRRGSRTALPGIFLSNANSLWNKMDELKLLMRIKDFSTSCVLCFTETWFRKETPDSALLLGGFQLFLLGGFQLFFLGGFQLLLLGGFQLLLLGGFQLLLLGGFQLLLLGGFQLLLLGGFQLFLALSGERAGGGVCFSISSDWCTDVTVISQHCSPAVEHLFINCRPFYSPREFASFVLASVYIAPDADVREAQRTLADCIQQVERTHPDALVIVLGDFNQSNLRYELPRYKQFIKCPTRAENTLDHCYTTQNSDDEYRAVPRAALGLSDHVMVHLIPTYRQKLKLTKPSVSTTKRWTSEAVEELRTCLDTTDWDMFKGATHDLDEYTDTGTSYIHFCEERILPTRTRVSYSNDKPWFTPRLRQIRKEKEAALKSGDRDRGQIPV